jgi:hypothetical protein
MEDSGMDQTLTLVCVLVPVGLLSSWGVGSLMAAIGKIRGWNTKLALLAFWVSAILYGLLMTFVVLSDAYILVTNTSATTIVIPLSMLIIFGIVLSPLGILVLRWRYPDVLMKSKPSQATPNLDAQVAIEKRPSSSGNVLRSKPESVAPPVNKPTANTGSGHIFVSYRRSDSADIAGRIYDRLIGKFGRDPIFKDVDSIPLGLDFKEYLDKKVGECDVLLAIIGDRWLEASDSAGKHRLEDPSDFVRIEIQSALERGIPVIPLLVRDAHMPREENLPSSLRKLVYRNGILIRSDPDFHRDMDRLIAALEKYIRHEK